MWSELNSEHPLTDIVCGELAASSFVLHHEICKHPALSMCAASQRVFSRNENVPIKKCCKLARDLGTKSHKMGVK